MQDIVIRFGQAQRSPRTTKTYERIAALFVASLGESQAPDCGDVEAFLARPLKSGRRASEATYNQQLAAIRAFARFAVKEGTWANDPTVGLDFLEEPERDRAFLVETEVHRLFHAVETVSPPHEQARDRAIVALCFAVGLRLSEIVRLDIGQVDLATNTLIGVMRKRRRVQDLALGDRAADVLSIWLAERARHAESSELALFISSRRGRLSGRTIDRLFERLRKEMGTPKNVTPHTGRHTFITRGLSRGGEISAVSRLAGHASVTTTMRYRHFLDGEQRKTVALIDDVIPHEILGSDSGVRAAAEAEILSKQLRVRAASPANDNGTFQVDDQEDLVDEGAA